MPEERRSLGAKGKQQESDLESDWGHDGEDRQRDVCLEARVASVWAGSFCVS